MGRFRRPAQGRQQGTLWMDRQANLLAKACEFVQVLSARGNSAHHVATTARHVRRLLASMDAFNESAVQRAVGAVKALGRSGRTCNHHLRSLKSFFRWSLRNGYIDFDPSAHVPAYSEKRDRRHERSPFTDAELERLFASAPPERAAVYYAAAVTGLRQGALRRLLVEQFDLDSPSPCVRVWACQQKGGKEQVIPIRPDAAQRLKMFLAGRMGKAFDMPARWSLIRQMRTDLLAAKIAYCCLVDTDGVKRRRCVRDFHALRHTYGTRLALSGVPLKVAQHLMGHSTPVLTANVYSHVDTATAARELDRLPPLSASF